MSFLIEITKRFEKESKPLFKKYRSLKKDISDLIDELAMNPKLGTPLGSNLYKVRLSIKSKGGGKSGGARIITYVIIKSEIVYLASIYDKADYDTADIDRLLKALKNEGL